MSEFGPFHPTQELYCSPSTTVMLARSANRSGDFVLKAFEPAKVAGVLTKTKGVQTVLIQSAMTFAQAKHWAPVYAAGTGAGATWYATDYYKRSLHFIMGGRVHLPPAAVYAIVRDVLHGLRELRDACGRGHGNLRAGNVLLIGRIGPKMRAVLADAAPDAPANCERVDLHAVVRLVRTMIEHCNEKAWTKARSGWLDFCEHCQRASLDDAIVRFRRLRPRRYKAAVLSSFVTMAACVAIAAQTHVLPPNLDARLTSAIESGRNWIGH